MKKRLFILLLTLALALSLFPAALAAGRFSDIPVDAAYAPAVAWCREQGLMDGVSADRFDPEGTLTRAMLATVLYRAAGTPAVTASANFSDVQAGSWYTDAVLWASGGGLLQGYGIGMFGPNDPVSVEMLDIVMARYRGEKPVWTGDPVRAKAATRAQVAAALHENLNEEIAGEETTGSGKILVAYFSATGTTRGAAERVQAATGGDLFEIVPAQAYTSADLNYNDASSRSQVEQRDAAARPAISGAAEGMDGYDVIFLGYPIWNGRPPKIISTFLESYDVTGKTIVPFCTSGSSGFSDSGLYELAGGAQWLEGRRLNGMSQDAVTQWVEGLQLNVEEGTGMRMIVTSGDTTVVFELNDSPAALSLAAQLPLTLNVQPFGSNEQTFYPPTALDTSGTPDITSAQAGTLAYYAPWKDVVMFYGSFSGGGRGVLFELGKAVEGADAIRELGGTITITAE
ncbi:hypothetical protein CE91St41_24080 [Oscillospiraceae bacterium]|nr:hypothetical protein CE91St40_13460 [Oscillospiraceae bacterium]BDF75519.1 hypothetical protein CE91St41_24080 [Oscillospiraceae bacterium]